jgi:hypothetical protein
MKKQNDLNHGNENLRRGGNEETQRMKMENKQICEKEEN